MKNFFKKFNRVTVFMLILVFLMSDFVYSKGTYLLRKPLGEDERVGVILSYETRVISQIREFSDDMLTKMEDLGGALYKIDKAIELSRKKKDIEEGLDEMQKALDLLISVLDEKKEIDGVPQRIYTKVMECYRNPLYIFVLTVGLLRDKDLESGEGDWIQDAQFTAVRDRIAVLKRKYDELYYSAFKLSKIDKVPEESMSHTDFAEQCSDANPDDALERTKIAIFTFNHGPATNPVDYLHRLTGSFDFLIMLFEERSEFQKVCADLKKFNADFLKESNPTSLWRECVNILRMGKYNFMFMAAWHRELLRLAQTRIRLDELEKIFGEHQDLCKQYGIAQDEEIDTEWKMTLESAKETVEILENRYRFAKGIVVKKTVDLEEIVKIASSNKGGIQYPGVIINKKFSGPIYIQGDRYDLVNAIANIIINVQYWAMEKSKEKTKVEININVEDGIVRISISDNGPGIEKNAIEDIFKFSYTTRKGGTGVGLAETRYVVQDYNGTINVKSQLGEGTTFTITLPVVKPDQTLGGKLTHNAPSTDL